MVGMYYIVGIACCAGCVTAPSAVRHPNCSIGRSNFHPGFKNRHDNKMDRSSQFAIFRSSNSVVTCTPAPAAICCPQFLTAWPTASPAEVLQAATTILLKSKGSLGASTGLYV